MTDTQRRILAFIVRFIDEHSWAPSTREIILGCEVSSSSVVAYNLRALHKKGYITRSETGESRALGMTAYGRVALQLEAAS